MTEEQIRIAQQLYGMIMILIRGAFLGLFLDLFLEKEILNRAKIIMISAVMTIIGLILFAIPFSTRGMYSLIGLIVIAIVFWLINPKVLPHSIFVFFLWNNVFYVWYLANFAIFNEITDKVTGAIDYSKEGAIERLWLWMFALIVAQIVFMALTLFGEYLVVRKLCQKKYDMSWTEALYLSVYSAVSYIICYMIADVMVVPLEKEVFLLLDEKREMVFTLPLLALLLFIGEISAIATWQRYRRLKEEELRLQEELKQQEFIRKKIEYTEKYHDRIRTLRHDMAGKLMILKSFIENGKYEDAEQFLGEMDIELSRSSIHFTTGNPVTDVVINEAAAQADSLRCKFQADFSFPIESGIGAIDVGIILNNLLDNALEAVAVIPENERYIKLTGEFKENFFLIRAENSFDGMLKRGLDGNIVSRKRQQTDGELHGIGLKSVMSIADKYLGTMDISSENKVFKVRVMLQSTEDDYSLHQTVR